MYSTLATRLFVDENGEVSQPVSMDGANAARQDATVFHLALGTATGFTIDIEGSNDLENWEDLANTLTFTAEAYQVPASFEADVSFAYIRLRYGWSGTPNGSSKAIVNTGVNTFHE